MVASESSRAGRPSSVVRHGTPANLSSSLEPKRAQTGCWASARMLTQKRPCFSIAAHEREPLVGQNSTSGGSRVRAANDWQAEATGAGAAPPAGPPQGVRAVVPWQDRPT